MTVSDWLIPRFSLAHRAKHCRAWAKVATSTAARAALIARAEQLEEAAARHDADLAAQRMSDRAPAAFRWATKVLQQRHADPLERAAALELQALEYEELGMAGPAETLRRQAAYALGAFPRHLDDVPA